MNHSHKDAAISFLKTIVARKIEEAYTKYVSPKMRHHNAYFPDDAQSLKQAMIEAHTKFPDTTIDIKQAIEEGELVTVLSHVTMKPSGPSVAVVHMFRFEGDKIIEMWDVGQAVPENSPNKNGMF
jgi:predicted SnoaL-like aldol condensation-catalyzing enzyme